MKPVVLYEDQLARDEKPSQFGLHQLALACVADRRGLDRWRLTNEFAAYVCKGRDKLLRELSRRKDDPAALVAAIDHDEIRPALRLSVDACKRTVVDEIHAQHHPRVRVVLVVENTEDVLRAVGASLGLPALTAKPTPRERDKMLHALADAPAERRASFLAAYPPFARLVKILNELLEA